ncbi:MAG: tRNA (adenosine(37)-N6)-dimethylallyltransferase MiaA [Xanthomonadales bacterium]|nr:tRNA (adenosine(37)-N6)-dimethylallyltransferase MiaA [Xanthomonadales bacterium]
MKPSRLPAAVFLMGPTASGKTGLAVELCQRYPLEIISVDSALVYRGMDIGTAKPDRTTLKLAPHRLIDIRDPAESYSAAEFCDDALREMASITAGGKVPLLVGGTMLYFRALEHGLSVLPPADAKVRKRLEQQAAEIGWSAMHEILQQKDPQAASRIHPNDPQRIQRALEVISLSGRSMSELYEKTAAYTLGYRLHKIVISPEPRSVLHERIEQRFDLMINAGFIDEMKGLFARSDLNADLPSMRAVGYRQGWEWLQGKYTFEEMRERAIIATRQLAKRQLTWLRRESASVWYDLQTDGVKQEVIEVLGGFLEA